MNHITIKYRAKLSWSNYGGNERFQEYYTDVLCDVTHVINLVTLQTVSFNFEPVKEHSAH